MDSFLKSAQEKFGAEGNQEDIVKQAESFASKESGSGENQSSSATPAPTGGDGAGEAGAKAPTSGASGQTQSQSQGHADITGNAKTLYQGIQDKMAGKEINDAQLAGAAGDLLQAAKNSGLDKDGQYTDYFNKAEGYLQKYGQGGSGAPKPDTSSESAPPKE